MLRTFHERGAKMHQKEDLVAKAGPALGDPLIRKLLRLACGVPGRNAVNVMERVCDAFKWGGEMAASMRYAALLARDFPETFHALIEND